LLQQGLVGLGHSLEGHGDGGATGGHGEGVVGDSDGVTLGVGDHDGAHLIALVGSGGDGHLSAGSGAGGIHLHGAVLSGSDGHVVLAAGILLIPVEVGIVVDAQTGDVQAASHQVNLGQVGQAVLVGQVEGVQVVGSVGDVE